MTRYDIEEWRGFAAECLARPMPSKAQGGMYAARMLADSRDQKIVALADLLLALPETP